eukprot:scaffold96132_cov22-Tisochrysis_lutea.AAC.1
MEVLKDCYLFNGCKARFLDQVLAAVRMELFMPNVSKLLDRVMVTLTEYHSYRSVNSEMY